MKLSELAHGRDNNFNLLRIIASFAVLVVHSYPLTMGDGHAEPFKGILGMSIGSISVDVFFVASGFLVTASILTRHSLIEFVWARVLRIYPALIVSIFFTVFVLGPFFTTLPLPAYFADRETYTYLVRCCTLFAGVSYNLPGVFELNPYKCAVNGSLWTMPFEIRMYALLAVLWGGLKLFPGQGWRLYRAFIFAFTVISGLCFIGNHFFFHFTNVFARDLLKLSFMFFSGASFYLLREHVVLSRRIFVILALIISATVALGQKEIFFVLYTVTVAYLLFFVAYVPSGGIRKDNVKYFSLF